MSDFLANIFGGIAKRFRDQGDGSFAEVVYPATSGASAAVSFARTADTNAYAANDVVGFATAAGGAVLTFANVANAAGEVMITSIKLEIDDTALISGETSYRLYLYDVAPPSNLG